MKKWRQVAVICSFAIAAAFLAAVPGCEEEGDAASVKQYFDGNSYEGAPSGQAFPALALSPTEVALDALELSAAFTVTGGQAPYAWSVADISLGTVVAGTSDAVYNRNGAAVGANVVIVTDARGITATAAVIQN